MSEIIVKWIFKSSVVFLFAVMVFGYGLAIERLQIWPYEIMESLYETTSSVVKFGEPV
jgi:hypothetical protein